MVVNCQFPPREANISIHLRYLQKRSSICTELISAYSFLVVPLIYADYYFLEALLRWKNLNKMKS
jgi:hypothetical protein